MFHVGRVYNRKREIHGQYGGQPQGGMSTPKDHPVILLFTGESGAEHGYKDEPKPDGAYWYTGEGQKGDMQFVRSNRALRDHKRDGKRVYLFEALGRGDVRHIGEVSYLGHHVEERPDTNGEPRRAIVFELGIEPERGDPARGVALGQTKETSLSYSARSLGKKPLHELRQLALTGTSQEAPISERRKNVRVRSNAVRAYVLKRADGVCEGCRNPAPFLTRKRQPYLEPHHTTRLADGGPDHPAHVIALCPTCHRRVHHGQHGDEYNEQLIERLSLLEETG